jgi:hypothetical protein
MVQIYGPYFVYIFSSIVSELMVLNQFYGGGVIGWCCVVHPGYRSVSSTVIQNLSVK